MLDLTSDVLLSEYEALIDEVGPAATDDQIIAALVLGSDWTPRGAAAILDLARTYGTSILRNALALAWAMKVEDGDSGL